MSARHFFCDPADIEVEFERNATGQVTGLCFQQGDMGYRFARVQESTSARGR